MGRCLEWLSRAACAERDPNLYTVEPEMTNQANAVAAQARATIARELCRGCPVAAECARDALKNEAGGTIRAGVYVPEHSLKKRMIERELAHLALALISGNTITADALDLDVSTGEVRWGGRAYPAPAVGMGAPRG